MACLHGGPQRQGCSWKRGLWHDTEPQQPAHRCRAAGKSPCCLPLLPVPLSSQTYSPFASSSQISKKTIRSYLHWHGPALGRVMVLSFVAGTVMDQKDSLKGELATDTWSEAHDSQQGKDRAGRDCRETLRGGSKAGESDRGGHPHPGG